MLLEFKAQNFRSFRDEAVFSMLAAGSVKEHDGSDDASDNNLAASPLLKEKVLKFAALYGANGSGKSNLIRGLTAMRSAVLRSVLNDKLISRLSEEAFRFDVDSENQPSSFEITFTNNSALYRYGFEFFKGKVTAEWLFRKASGSSKESYCFKREGQEIKTNPRLWRKTTGLASKTRNTALFLTVCSQFNIQEAIEIKEWFRKKLLIISEFDQQLLDMTALAFRNEKPLQSDILAFMQEIDSSILGINVNLHDFKPSDLPEPIRSVLSEKQLENLGNSKEVEILTQHDRFLKDKKVSTAQMSFSTESAGTQKAFALSGPWFSAIRQGATLVVDEFGASLHTKLAIELVRVFQRSQGDAQLIAATHDTNLLRKDLLRRDQIWFTEKNAIGATDLYSLVEYRIEQARAVRNDASYSKDYLAGRYGAIPFFGNVDQFLGGFANDEKS